MRLAFDLLNHPLDGVQLIEASAGTGKTWTLCALYLRLLLEKKLDVGRILVVTFTRAAAAELRERIRARIHDLAHAIAHSENSEDPLACGRRAAMPAGAVAARTRTLSFRSGGDLHHSWLLPARASGCTVCQRASAGI